MAVAVAVAVAAGSAAQAQLEQMKADPRVVTPVSLVAPFPYNSKVGGSMLTLTDLLDHPLMGSSGREVHVLTVANRGGSANAILVGGQGGGNEHRELQPGQSETFYDVDPGQIWVIVEGSDADGTGKPRCAFSTPGVGTPTKNGSGHYAYVDFTTHGRGIAGP